MMSVSAGTRLGPYEILESIGVGGMGEVYRAHDTRLERTVAIKILPEAFAADPSRLRRFEQESRSVASLNHPNILAIYDVGVSDGCPYLVMEFLDGKNLRERLNEGPIPVSKAVDFAQQIARGLAAAHDRGVVHRDLKPENVFLTRDGHAKIVDFGLAKPISTSADVTLGSQTTPGVVLGTVGYMSPEQVRGEAVDARADIFSFGAVLYEMLGGKRAFTGDSSVEVMTAILKSDPPEFDPSEKIPPGLDRIVRHCLEKNPADRFQTARDLGFALGALSGTSGSSTRPVFASRSRTQWIPWAATAVALAVVAALLVLLLSSHAPKERMQFQIPTSGEIASFAISTDGQMLAYVTPDENTGIGVLYIQRIGEPTATRLDGTEDANYPFWSPDDKYIGFFASGHLKKVDATGGVPQILANVTGPRGGAWGSKNVILYVPSAGGAIWRINPDGSGNAPLSDAYFQDGESSHRFPVFLPDGEHFLFWSGNFNETPGDQTSGIYISSLSEKKKELVVLCRSSPAYSNGYLHYVNDQNALDALPIDHHGKSLGEPHQEAGFVGRYPSTYWSAISASYNGVLVYGRGTGAPLSQLTWYDRAGKQIGTVGEPGILANPSLSPDDSRVAIDGIDLKTKNIDVWIENLQRNTVSRFTFAPSEETNGVWSRDGSFIAFRSASDSRLQVRKSLGLEPPRVLLSSTLADDSLPTAWAPDGQHILMTLQPTEGGSSLALSDLNGKFVSFLKGAASYTNGQISPDGNWVLYASNESGDWEVYATTFPVAQGKIQISRGGGTEPRWRGDGKEAFYLAPKNMLTAIPIDGQGGTLSTGSPQPLFQIPGRAPISSTDLFTYDVTRDGKRFLVNRYLKPVSAPPLNIILNAGQTGH